MQITLEAMLPAQITKDLAGTGNTPLICKPNRDSAYLLWSPMLHCAKVYDDEAATDASKAMTHLPYQLLASRISEAVASKLPRRRSS
jgi:predicted component of type VI protein secretion system